eukprot:scaffold10046_cov36-Prasinocladus_malaysianus.AAC.1
MNDFNYRRYEENNDNEARAMSPRYPPVLSTEGLQRRPHSSGFENAATVAVEEGDSSRSKAMRHAKDGPARSPFESGASWAAAASPVASQTVTSSQQQRVATVSSGTAPSRA